MKKLKFTHFFLKKFIPVIIPLLLIATMFNTLQYVSSLMASRQDFEVSTLMAQSNISEWVARGKDTPEEISCLLAKQVDYHYKSTRTAFVYIDEEYNIIATSEWNAFLFHQRERNAEDITAVTDVYKCGSEEFLGMLDDEIENNSGRVYEIKEAYVKDGLFIPGDVTIFESDYHTVVKTINFTPENKEEYLYIPRNEFYWRDVGTRDKELLAEAVRAADGRCSDKKPTSESFSNIKAAEMNNKLYSIYYFDFFAENLKFVFANTATMVLLALFITFIAAFISYKKYTVQYETDEYRRNMTNALAHDLKSPLTAIYGYAENLKDNIHSEKREYYADAVLENVRYMNSIITNTLDLAKLEIGEKGVKREKLDVALISDELYKKYRPQAEARNISFKASGSCTVTADKALLTQALENLISNAVKFTADNGSIDITATDDAYTITNDCDKALKTENIGKPFGKSDESRSNRTGSGLGLSIVKNITALHKFGFSTKAENGKFTAEITFANK